jgi:hypothetical protein
LVEHPCLLEECAEHVPLRHELLVLLLLIAVLTHTFIYTHNHIHTHGTYTSIQATFIQYRDREEAVSRGQEKERPP